MDGEATFRRGIDLFNRGEFWESHEAWEGIWMTDSTDGRLFYQGLIQVAAAFHHLGSGNLSGMRTLLRRAAGKLEGFHPFHEGIDLERLLEQLRPWREALEREPVRLPDASAIPKLVLEKRS